MPKAITHKEFMKDLEHSCSLYKDGEIEILDEYVNSKTKIRVKHRYGVCSINPAYLIQNREIKITSAENKTEYFKAKLRDKNVYYKRGDFEVIGEYINTNKAIEVKNKYGTMLAEPNTLLQGKSPGILVAVDRRSYWINKANEVHGGKFDYGDFKYINNKNKLPVICGKHGEFLQEANSHLQGIGCPKCGFEVTAEKLRAGPTTFTKTGWFKRATDSKNFDSYKVYILECWDQDTGERFVKVGRTFMTISRRYKGGWHKLPYNYKILKIVERKDVTSYEDMEYIFNLENRFKRLYNKHKYVPKREFNGMYECVKLR